MCSRWFAVNVCQLTSKPPDQIFGRCVVGIGMIIGLMKELLPPHWGHLGGGGGDIFNIYLRNMFLTKSLDQIGPNFQSSLGMCQT